MESDVTGSGRGLRENDVTGSGRGLKEDILRGCLNNLPPLGSKVVRVFVSSTFSDTVKERNALLKNVYPKLKDFCKTLGLEFQVVDMRWGVREEAQDDHMTSNLCVREITKCRDLSAGPTFVAFLGQKYGYRPFPANIPADEYQLIHGALEAADLDDLDLLDTWFKRDENESPPLYKLQPISSILYNYINASEPSLMEADRKAWWQVFAKLQQLLRKGALMVHHLGVLSMKQIEKYFISVTEDEIYQGLLSDPDKQRQLVIQREITNLSSNKHIATAKKFMDLRPDGEVDEEASALLREMTEVKIREAAVSEEFTLRYSVKWAGEHGIDEQVHKDYLSTLCEDFYVSMTKLIQQCHMRVHSEGGEMDGLYTEVLQHATMCKNRCEVFLGRGEYLTVIKTYLGRSSQGKGEPLQPLVIHGQSGSGKTSIVAMSAMMATQTATPKQTVILRFLGTSPLSSNIYNVLSSICRQICFAYSIELEPLPDDFVKLTAYFKNLMKVAPSASQPLVILLDSLDQLNASYNSHSLSWLPHSLPAHVHLIVSVLHNKHNLLKRLKAKVTGPEHFLEICPLGEELGYDIVRLWLKISGRKLTRKQNDIVQEAFNQCSLPLYTKLVFEEVHKWPSYLPKEKMVLPPTVQGIINMLLKKIEVQHGLVLVSHALSYLTASRNGLSEAELEDILSLDDEVLNEVFTFWLPPIRRLPPLLWTRIHEDLSSYLVSREANGVTVLAWYHRQFLEVAMDRYLCDKVTKKQTHSRLADYFLGKWAGKDKPFTYNDFLVKRLGLGSPKGSADRKVAPQPLLWKRPDGTVQYNCRKLSELPHALYYSGRLEEMWKMTVFNYDWIGARIKASSLPEMLGDISLAKSAHEDSKFGLLSSALKMAHSSLWQLPKSLGPELIARLKGYACKSKDIEKLMEQCEKSSIAECALLPLYQCFTTPVEALVSCLEGHSKRVRDLQFSRNGKQLFSISEDGSVSIWDVETGERLHNVDISYLKVNRHSELHVTRSGLVCELYTEDSPLLVVDPIDGLVKLTIGNRKPGFIHDTIACKKLAIREGDIINIRDGRVHKRLGFLTGKSDYVVLALTHNEQYVLAGEKQATRMYSIDTEKVCVQFPGDNVPSKIAITRDDTMAVIGYAVSCIVRVVNIDMNSAQFGKGLFRFDYQKAYPDFAFHTGDTYCQEVSELTLSHDCEWAVVNLKYRHAFVVALQDKEVVMLDSPEENALFSNVGFSSDDQYVVGVCGSLLCVWDTDTGSVLSTKELQSQLSVLTTAPASNLLASVTTADHTISVWNIDKLEEGAKSTVKVYEHPVNEVLVSSQLRLAFIKTYVRLDACKGYHYVDYFGLDVWDLTTFRQQSFLDFGHHGLLSDMCMSADGCVMVVCTNNMKTSHLYVIQCASGQMMLHLSVPKAPAVHLSPKGDHILVECTHGQQLVELYSTWSGAVAHSMADSHYATFTLDSQYAVWAQGTHLFMFSLTDGTRDKFNTHLTMTKVQMIPNRHDLVLVTESRKKQSKVQVFSLITKTRVFSLKSVSPAGLQDFAKNGSLAVDSWLQVYDMEDGKLLMRCTSEDDAVKAELPLVRLTDSGCHVVWADTQPVHCIRAFHVESRTITATVSTHSQVHNLHLAEAGFKVMVGCADGHFLAFGLHAKSTAEQGATSRQVEAHESLAGEQHKWSIMRLSSVMATDIDPLYQVSRDPTGVHLPQCCSRLSQTMRKNAKQVRVVSLETKDVTKKASYTQSLSSTDEPPSEPYNSTSKQGLYAVNKDSTKRSRMCILL